MGSMVIKPTQRWPAYKSATQLDLVWLIRVEAVLCWFHLLRFGAIFMRFPCIGTSHITNIVLDIYFFISRTQSTPLSVCQFPQPEPPLLTDRLVSLFQYYSYGDSNNHVHY